VSGMEKKLINFDCLELFTHTGIQNDNLPQSHNRRENIRHAAERDDDNISLIDRWMRVSSTELAWTDTGDDFLLCFHYSYHFRG
jgi:hypothetical protein